MPAEKSSGTTAGDALSASVYMSDAVQRAFMHKSMPDFADRDNCVRMDP